MDHKQVEEALRLAAQLWPDARIPESHLSEWRQKLEAKEGGDAKPREHEGSSRPSGTAYGTAPHTLLSTGSTIEYLGQEYVVESHLLGNEMESVYRVSRASGSGTRESDHFAMRVALNPDSNCQRAFMVQAAACAETQCLAQEQLEWQGRVLLPLVLSTSQARLPGREQPHAALLMENALSSLDEKGLKLPGKDLLLLVWATLSTLAALNEAGFWYEGDIKASSFLWISQRYEASQGSSMPLPDRWPVLVGEVKLALLQDLAEEEAYSKRMLKSLGRTVTLLRSNSLGCPERLLELQKAWLDPRQKAGGPGCFKSEAEKLNADMDLWPRGYDFWRARCLNHFTSQADALTRSREVAASAWRALVAEMDKEQEATSAEEEATLAEEDSEVASAHICLARSLQRQGDAAQALKSLRRAIQLWPYCLMKAKWLLLDIAIILSALCGFAEQARHVLEKAELAYMKPGLASNSESSSSSFLQFDKVMALLKLSAAYGAIGNTTKAEELMRSVFSIIEWHRKDSDMHTASAMAIASRIVQDPAKKEEYLTKALGIQKAYFGDFHSSVAETLRSLGTVYFKKADGTQKAKEVLEAAMIIEQEFAASFAPANTDVSTLWLLGRVYRVLGDAEAENDVHTRLGERWLRIRSFAGELLLEMDIVRESFGSEERVTFAVLKRKMMSKLPGRVCSFVLPSSADGGENKVPDENEDVLSYTSKGAVLEVQVVQGNFWTTDVQGNFWTTDALKYWKDCLLPAKVMPEDKLERRLRLIGRRLSPGLEKFQWEDAFAPQWIIAVVKAPEGSLPKLLPIESCLAPTELGDSDSDPDGGDLRWRSEVQVSNVRRVLDRAMDAHYKATKDHPDFVKKTLKMLVTSSGPTLQREALATYATELFPGDTARGLRQAVVGLAGQQKGVWFFDEEMRLMKHYGIGVRSRKLAQLLAKDRPIMNQLAEDTACMLSRRLSANEQHRQQRQQQQLLSEEQQKLFQTQLQAWMLFAASEKGLHLYWSDLSQPGSSAYVKLRVNVHEIEQVHGPVRGPVSELDSDSSDDEDQRWPDSPDKADESGLPAQRTEGIIDCSLEALSYSVGALLNDSEQLRKEGVVIDAQVIRKTFAMVACEAMEPSLQSFCAVWNKAGSETESDDEEAGLLSSGVSLDSGTHADAASAKRCFFKLYCEPLPAPANFYSAREVAARENGTLLAYFPSNCAQSQASQGEVQAVMLAVDKSMRSSDECIHFVRLSQGQTKPTGTFSVSEGLWELHCVEAFVLSIQNVEVKEGNQIGRMGEPASSRFQRLSDKTFLEWKEALQKNGFALLGAPEWVRQDRELVQTAVEGDKPLGAFLPSSSVIVLDRETLRRGMVWHAVYFVREWQSVLQALPVVGLPSPQMIGEKGLTAREVALLMLCELGPAPFEEKESQINVVQSMMAHEFLLPAITAYEEWCAFLRKELRSRDFLEDAIPLLKEPGHVRELLQLGGYKDAALLHVRSAAGQETHIIALRNERPRDVISRLKSWRKWLSEETSSKDVHLVTFDHGTEPLPSAASDDPGTFTILADDAMVFNWPGMKRIMEQGGIYCLELKVRLGEESGTRPVVGSAMRVTAEEAALRKGCEKIGNIDSQERVEFLGKACRLAYLPDSGGKAWVEFSDREGWFPLECLQEVERNEEHLVLPWLRRSPSELVENLIDFEVQMLRLYRELGQVEDAIQEHMADVTALLSTHTDDPSALFVIRVTLRSGRNRIVVAEASTTFHSVVARAVEKFRSDKTKPEVAVEDISLQIQGEAVDLAQTVGAWHDRGFVGGGHINEVKAVQRAGASFSSLELVPEEMRNDRELAERAVKRDGRSLGWLREELRSDRGLVLAAIQSYPRALQWATTAMRSDRQLVLEATRSCPDVFQFAADQLRGERQFVMEVLGICGAALQFVDPTLAADKDVVLCAVAQDGFALQYLKHTDAARALLADEDIVLKAVQQDMRSIKEADVSLQQDELFMLRVICSGSVRSIERISPQDLSPFHFDQMFLEAAISCRVSDRSAVATLLMKWGECADKYVMLICFTSGAEPVVIAHGAATVLSVLEDAVKKLPDSADPWEAGHIDLLVEDGELVTDVPAIENIPGIVQGGPVNRFTAVRHWGRRLAHDPSLYKSAPEDVRMSLDMMIIMVQRDGTALEMVPVEFRNNSSLVLEAVKQNGMALQYASERLQDDVGVVTAAVQQDGLALQFASERIRNESEPVIQAAFRQNQMAYHFVEDIDLKAELLVDLILPESETW